jgi:hypothetical protein
MKKRRLPYLAYNLLSALGAALVFVAILTFVALWVLSLTFQEEANPYFFGILLYLVVPAFLAVGMILTPLGMLIKWRRWKRQGEPERMGYPLIDFNRANHRNAALAFLLGTIIFTVTSAVASYGAFHYTESVAFCGTTCHSVMEPEHTTYQNSPHARVSCAQCHVGTGAEWFVKAKISGLYQVYATFADKYPRPIPTPIESLRPAQATCEQCHWPEKAYGSQQKLFRHFLYDEENTDWPISLLIKTGGGDPKLGREEGIHWHMNIGVNVEYIARDEKRQDIPWMRLTDPNTGRVTIYQDSSNPLSEEEISAATPRTMDCLDCHNRPSHIYRSPDKAIDEQIAVGRIDRALPAIKRLAVSAMDADYASVEEAKGAIANQISDFYRTKHPEIYATQKLRIDEAIVATQDAYKNNVFPVMRAKWSDYPDNIGHLENPGCMRCHDAQHLDSEGIPLSRECNTCHIILTQGTGDRFEMAGAEPGLRFSHPEDIGEAWTEMGCYECHSGIQP